ncbi:MAG: hypothetical protein AAGB24_14445 [Bacteroidota bacterium]
MKLFTTAILYFSCHLLWGQAALVFDASQKKFTSTFAFPLTDGVNVNITGCEKKDVFEIRIKANDKVILPLDDITCNTSTVLKLQKTADQ